jgi:EPS-associated MarR family transcriptional regulator
MTSLQVEVQEDTHFRIMRIVQENSDMNQRYFADKLCMSVCGLSYCLNALITTHVVKKGDFHKSKKKRKYVSLLKPLEIAEMVALTSRFLKRMMKEYEPLKLEMALLKSNVGEDEACGLRKAPR